ncbi:DUF1800 domain-containing protein [Kiritimatiellaeota bacterium B1221]|nr:DUF1800 domain-containing protein [Kiritimatiellaeota bacterium B1221]
MARIPTIRRRQWNRQTAAHLAVRAGLGPTPRQLDELEQMAPSEAVEQFLRYPAESTRNQTPDWFHAPLAQSRFPKGMDRKAFYALEKEERQNLQREYNKVLRKNLEKTREWWMERMVQSPHPLEEKLTLFWHGHFATSVQKVRDPYPMLLQNLMFRERGRGRWRDMILALSQDPAMLIYLDNARSSKRKPNENYARELMELFTLGEGNYTEEDIRNAARAFAGWSIDPQEWTFKQRTGQMDTGRKVFMQAEGRLTGEDIIDEILKQPAAADFLAERLWTFFASETPNKSAIDHISRSLKDENFDLSAALRVLFTHEDFYHPSVIRGQIKSPVQLSVQLVRTLNAQVPPGKSMVKASKQLGQNLFEPPSVKGWDGGAAWITASNLSLRYSLAAKWIKMKNSFNPQTLIPDPALSRVQVRELLFDRFYHSPLREQEQASMDQYLSKMPPVSEWQRAHYSQILQHLVQQPQYQLT